MNERQKYKKPKTGSGVTPHLPDSKMTIVEKEVLAHCMPCQPDDTDHDMHNYHILKQASN